MKGETSRKRDRSDTNSPQDPSEQSHDPVSEYLEPEANDADALARGLQSGQLTPSQQETLAGILFEDEPPQHVMLQQRQTTMYSGPLPNSEEFNAYDDHARRAILQMAVDDQKHTHDMQKTGLTGAIEKDKRGQRYGLTIALAGLLAATIIAPFSPTVAGIIGALDIFGMVALFVAPRVLEGRAAKPHTADRKPENGQQSDEAE